MLGKKAGAATSPEVLAPQQHQYPSYTERVRVSRILQAHPAGSQIQHIQVVLGTILFALCWPTATNDDRAALLQCVDGLERKVIDLRRGGSLDG